MQNNFETVISQVKNLRRGVSNVWTEETRFRAPHKPILLLSVLEGFETGWISQNVIELNENLIDVFLRYWSGISPQNDSRIEYPFFHLSNEPFWSLKFKDPTNPHKIEASMGALHPDLVYATLGQSWYEMMQNPAKRALLRDMILSEYFSPETAVKLTICRDDLLETYAAVSELDYLLESDFMIDHKSFMEPKYITSKSIVRENAFRIRVRNAYNHHCAMCNMRIITSSGKSIVDAAHIIPHHLSLNNDPRNGLALCKSHHWMFDTFTVSINPSDYQIEISSNLYLNDNNPDRIVELKDRQITFPKESQLNPAKAALDYHYSLFRQLN